MAHDPCSTQHDSSYIDPDGGPSPPRNLVIPEDSTAVDRIVMSLQASRLSAHVEDASPNSADWESNISHIAPPRISEQESTSPQAEVNEGGDEQHEEWPDDYVVPLESQEVRFPRDESLVLCVEWPDVNRNNLEDDECIFWLLEWPEAVFEVFKDDECLSWLLGWPENVVEVFTDRKMMPKVDPMIFILAGVATVSPLGAVALMLWDWGMTKMNERAKQRNLSKRE
jgi:hypothetical protein